MKKMRKLSYLMVFAFLSVACGDPGVPTAPSAPSASQKSDAAKAEPPKAVKKGRKLVSPGGQAPAAP
ncbi:MAG: hypothetical protein ACP5XB_07105 [Isosphaeraceae bacterium]